jgi:hypothetical protein
VLANIYKTKEHVLTSGAPCYDAGTLHIQMRLGKAALFAAICTLSLCSRDIERAIA